MTSGRTLAKQRPRRREVVRAVALHDAAPHRVGEADELHRAQRLVVDRDRARLAYRRGVALDDERVDPVHPEDVREREAGGAGAHDHDAVLGLVHLRFSRLVPLSCSSSASMRWPAFFSRRTARSIAPPFIAPDGSTTLRLPIRRGPSNTGHRGAARAGVDFARGDAQAFLPNGLERLLQLRFVGRQFGAEHLRAVAAQKRRERALGKEGEDDLRGGAAIQRHRAAALVADEGRDGRAAFLVDAEDAIPVEPAEEDHAAGRFRQAGHDVDGALHERVGEADLAVELDDRRPERVAAFGHGLEEAGRGQQREVPVGARAGDAEGLCSTLRGPGRLARREQGEGLHEAVCARHRIAPALAPHDRGAPQVQGALFVGPDAFGAGRAADLELGGDLGEVAVGIADHEERVVSGAVAADAPDDRDADRAHPVRPVAERRPVGRLEGQVVVAALGRVEERERVVLGIGTEEAGAKAAGVVHDAVGDDEAERVAIEGEERGGVRAAEGEVLEARGGGGCRGRGGVSGRCDAEGDGVALGVGDCEGVGAEERRAVCFDLRSCGYALAIRIECRGVGEREGREADLVGGSPANSKRRRGASQSQLDPSRSICMPYARP